MSDRKLATSLGRNWRFHHPSPPPPHRPPCYKRYTALPPAPLGTTRPTGKIIYSVHFYVSVKSFWSGCRQFYSGGCLKCWRYLESPPRSQKDIITHGRVNRIYLGSGSGNVDQALTFGWEWYWQGTRARCDNSLINLSTWKPPSRLYGGVFWN